MGSICPGGHSTEKTEGERVGLQTQAEQLVTPRSPGLQAQVEQIITPKTPDKTDPKSPDKTDPKSPDKTDPKSPDKTGPPPPPHVPPGASCDNDSDKGNSSTPAGGKIPDPCTSESGGNISGSSTTSPSKSRHSPPVSRVTSSSPTRQCSLEGLGSLSSVWSRPEKWAEFRRYLSGLSEGEDSDGRPLLLVRYADFLQMFSRLDQAVKLNLKQTEVKQLVLDIADSEEDFFGRERGLTVIDGGVRKVVRRRIKAVRDGEEQAGVHVYKEVYPKVLDKLNELLGAYQNVKLNQPK